MPRKQHRFNSNTRPDNNYTNAQCIEASLYSVIVVDIGVDAVGETFKIKRYPQFAALDGQQDKKMSICVHDFIEIQHCSCSRLSIHCINV